MVVFVTEFVAKPGHSDHVCDAFENFQNDPESAVLHAFAALAENASRRILMMHVFATPEAATHFEQVALPGLMGEITPSLDLAGKVRKYKFRETPQLQPVPGQLAS